MQKIKPSLWFDANAEEAVHFYVSIFRNSRILGSLRYGEAAPGPGDSVLVIDFVLDGQEFNAFNGGPHFTFSEAISFSVDCATQEEIDYYWEKLSEGGRTDQCGWLKDKFGLSWQIVPTILGEMMRDDDSERSNRVMKAVLQMTKLDIAKLQKAYDQG